jgi:hypothetical protein
VWQAAFELELNRDMEIVQELMRGIPTSIVEPYVGDPKGLDLEVVHVAGTEPATPSDAHR